MANTFYIRGNSYWCKLLGEPYKNMNGDLEWAQDVAVKGKHLELLKEIVPGKIKNKSDDRGDFIQFRRRKIKTTGVENSPVPVFDAQGDPWPVDKKIGNGSEIQVKFKTYVSPGFKGNKPTTGVAILEVMVLKWEEFKPTEHKPKVHKSVVEEGEDWS